MRILLALFLSASSLFAQADYSTLLLLDNAQPPSTIITVDAVTGSAAANNANNPTTSHTQGSLVNGYVLVFIAATDGTVGDIQSLGVTYDGAAMTQLSASTAGSFTGMEVYGLAVGSKTGGSYSVAINDGSGDALWTVTGVVSLNNAHQSSAPTVAAANGTSTDPTVDVSSAAGELVVGAVSINGTTATASVGADQTERIATTRHATPGAVALAVSSELGAATTTHSYTLSSSVLWLIAAVAVEPAP